VYAERATGNRGESLRLARMCRDSAKGSLLERAERRAARLERMLRDAAP